MDQLQSELLLLIFKQLESNEMVKVTRVCKAWFDVINENQSPWRSLVLPDREQGWDASIIELFDRKSQSTLQRVSIKLWEIYNPHDRRFYYQRNESVNAILERSKRTLHYLHLSVSDTIRSSAGSVVAPFKHLSWKLPNLVDCAIGDELDRSLTRIVQNSQSREPSSSLRTLWIPSVASSSIFPSHLHIIDRLVSLHAYFQLSSSKWRTILEKPAQTLKDLKIDIREDAPERPQSSLDFPNLRVLDLYSLDKFPSWMKIPYSSTFIDHSYDSHLNDLPSISTVWLKDLHNIRTLQERCPILTEIRIDSVCDHRISKSKMRFKPELLSMLRTRRRHVKNGAEVDGVKMIPLETLIVNFEEFTGNQISQLRGMVKEVIDLNSVDRFIEVEI